MVFDSLIKLLKEGYVDKNNEPFFQFIRFGLVGVVSTLTHIGTLVLLVELIKLTPILASTIGFILAVIVSYFLNYRFTFRAQGAHTSYFPKYVLVCIIGFILNTGIMYLTIEILKWWYVAGQICTLMVVPISNFTLNRFWAFKSIKS